MAEMEATDSSSVVVQGLEVMVWLEAATSVATVEDIE